MTSPVPTSGKYVSGSFFYNIRRRALKRGIDFDLSLDYLDQLIESQDFRCAYTGMQIDAKPRRKATASLDRIDSSKGYVEGNVQFVQIAVNFAKHSCSEDDFLELVSSIYRHRIGKEHVLL